MKHLPRFILSLAYVLRRSMTWGLAVTAVVTPLIVERHLEPRNAANFELSTQNAAAIAFDRWQRGGRVRTVAGSHPLLDLDVPCREWEALSPSVRAAVQRRITWGAIRGVQVDQYLVHDGRTVLVRSVKED